MCYLDNVSKKKVVNVCKMLSECRFLVSQSLFIGILSKFVAQRFNCNVCDYRVRECVLNYCAHAYIFIASETYKKIFFFIFFGNIFTNFFVWYYVASYRFVVCVIKKCLFMLTLCITLFNRQGDVILWLLKTFVIALTVNVTRFAFTVIVVKKSTLPHSTLLLLTFRASSPIASTYKTQCQPRQLMVVTSRQLVLSIFWVSIYIR